MYRYGHSLCFPDNEPLVQMSGMMLSLHSSIMHEIVQYLSIKSTANLVLTSKQYLPHLRDIKIKRRFHCLKIALIRLRYISNFIHDEQKILRTFVYKPSMYFYDVEDTLLIMTGAMHVFSHFEYCGPPDYLRNFAYKQYDILANIVLNYDDDSNYLTYISNVYGLIANTPISILREFMFKFEMLMEYDF